MKISPFVAYDGLLLALLILFGIFPVIPIIFGIPLVIQNMIIMLICLTTRYQHGTFVIFLFLLCIALGFPFLSGGRGGLTLFMSPTGGFILSWLLTPVITELIRRSCQHFYRKNFITLAVFMSCIIFPYLIGSIWIVFSSNAPLNTVLMGNSIFLPFDTLKLVLILLISKRIKKIRFTENFFKNH